MKKADLGSGSVFLLLGAAVCYKSWSLGLGSLGSPGLGFLPFLAGLCLVFLSLGILLFAVVKITPASPTPKFWPRSKEIKVVSLVFLSLVAYNLLWTKLGFTITTFLFIGFLFRVVGTRRWWVTIVGAGLSSFLAYLLFQTFLKSQLPTGFIGF
jgi:hypothetical protein